MGEDIFEQIRELVGIPIPEGISQYDLITRLKQLEQTIISLHDRILKGADSLSRGATELVHASDDLVITINTETQKIVNGFAQFGNDMANSTTSTIGAATNIGNDFIWMVNYTGYAMGQVAKYAGRFVNDGVWFMPVNGYQAFTWAFTRSTSVLTQIRNGFVKLKSSAAALAVAFTGMANGMKQAPVTLGDTIQASVATINAAVQNFTLRFGNINNDVAMNLKG